MRSLRAGLALVAFCGVVLLLLRAALHRDVPAPPEPAAAMSAPPPAASSTSAASAPAPTPSGAALAPAASAAAPSSACRDVLAHNERVLDGASGPGEVSFLEACYPNPSGGTGAWALRLDAWKKTGDWAGVETRAGSYTVVHIDAAGHTIESRPARGIEGGMSYSTVYEPVLFDFDGDGQPELFVRQFDKEHEGASSDSAKLYTFRGGKVVEYPGLPTTYDDMEDVDGDGRLDAIYHLYASVRVHPGSGFDFMSDGPALLAHSLPDGTFSTSDATAQTFARKGCPTSRGETADAGTGDVEPELCARLWGASRAEALALLRSLCPQGAKCEGGCAETNDPCVSFEDRARRLDLSPPLRLGP